MVYAESKVVLTLWGQVLQVALHKSPSTRHVLVAPCHPGAINSGIQHKLKPALWTYLLTCFFPLNSKTPAQGAVPVMHCATAGEVAQHGGHMWGKGPTMKLFKPLPRFTDATRDAAMAAVNAALKDAGRAPPVALASIA